jgi:hypothetical protein
MQCLPSGITPVWTRDHLQSRHYSFSHRRINYKEPVTFELMIFLSAGLKFRPPESRERLWLRGGFRNVRSGGTMGEKTFDRSAA